VRRSPLLAVLWLVLAAATAGGAGLPGELQEVPRLTWLTPGFLPDRGLMTVGLGGSRYHPGYNPTGGPAHYDVLQATAFLHWTPLSWLAVSGQQHWRSWSNYLEPGQPPSGSGLADGAFRLTVAVPWLPDWLGITAWGGGNLPVGQAALGEEAFSSEAGGSLSVALWRQNQWPELRLHASYGRRRNAPPRRPPAATRATISPPTRSRWNSARTQPRSGWSGARHGSTRPTSSGRWRTSRS